MKLLAFVCFVWGLYSTSNSMSLETLKKEHVIISSPVNITIYYTSSKDIIVGWDMRQVYIPHNVSPSNFSMLKQGHEIKVSKPKVPLVATNSSLINETASEDNSNNQTDSSASIEAAKADTTPHPSSAREKRANDDGTSSQSTEKEKSDDQSEDFNPTPFVCKPATYFSDYTVAINNNPGPLENKWATTLVNLTADIPMANITLTHDKSIEQKMVAFEFGCVTKFRIVYQPRFQKTAPQNVEVEHYHRVANISGLKEATTYSITIQAVYVHDEVLSSKPVFVRTKTDEESPQCACDWHGTVNLRNSCQIQPDGRMCQCRPEYQGQFCEECAPGYFRTAPFFPCNKCPCDEHSSLESTCRFEEGFLFCQKCEVGYRGNICHMCAPGFYRHGKFCVNCGCNGNSDKSQKNMCKADTGECYCGRNTTGFHCDSCLPGYSGDAVTYRNCTLTSELTGVVKPVDKGTSSSASSSLSMGAIAGLVVGLLLIMGVLCVGLVMYKRMRARQQRRDFWTVELRRDKDSTEFNSVHNDEAHLDDVDDLEFYEHHGGTTSVNKYSRLNEQI